MPQMPQQQVQPTPPPQPIDEKIWVTGEEGANAYLVARGEFVRLWDDKDNIFYEKEADASGRPTLRTYRYEQWVCLIAKLLAINLFHLFDVLHDFGLDWS